MTNPMANAAAVTAERSAAEAAVPTGIAPLEPFAVTALHGNSPTLVEIAVGSTAGVAEIILVSRDRHERASFTPEAGEKLVAPLAAGDYLVMAQAPADARPNLTFSRRILVSAGRAYSYGMPVPLSALPAAHPDPHAATPVLKRLAYTGSLDGAAELVVEWSTGIAAHCLCIRSPLWGEHWLPYAVPAAAALCLRDGAYEIRAAQLADDGRRLGGWSEVTELVIAEGRLAAAPSVGGGDLLDWLAVKPGWRADDNVEFHRGEADDGKVAVRLTWQAAGAANGLRYVTAYRPDGDGDWQTVISASPQQTLRLAPGRYRIRICAVDDVVFLRSEFFGECVLTVSASDPPALTHAVASTLADASVTWLPLPAGDASPDAELAEFVARPISSWAADRDAVAVDLNALAYGPSPQTGREDRDIAVTRVLAQGDLAGPLAPDQMAAAGDYFLRTGQLQNAWQVFEALGRRYRGVDFAQLRCAQLAASSGRGEEAHELLTLALSSPKSDPARSPSFGSAVPKAVRDRARIQQQALRAATAKADLLTARAGTLRDALENKERQYKEELPALRFKAQQYDRLMRELPALRYKAKRYDQVKDELVAGRHRGVVQLLRRWSVRLVGLRLH